VAAIAAGQPVKARRIAQSHMQDIIDYADQCAPTLLDRTIEWR
jgi:hypothetical protein